jgi:hypothetical protein
MLVGSAQVETISSRLTLLLQEATLADNMYGQTVGISVTAIINSR